MSADGYVATPDGRPAQLSHPAWNPETYGFVEIQSMCDAVLMGRTTFETALSADDWPWTGVDVFVLGSRRPPGTPDHVVIDSDPTQLLEKVRAANRGGDVHLVGGPHTVETFRLLGEVDELGLIVLPLLLGKGMRLTPAVRTDGGLKLKSERTLAGDAVEIIYTWAQPGP
jgi:dihydrofolate reductase